MATRGLFIIGFTVPEVLAILNKAKALMTQGTVMMNYTDSGTSASKQFVMPVADVIEECGYALQVLDPATYGKRRRYLTSNYRTIRDL